MGRLSAFLLALALGAVAALGLVACGSGDGADLLPGSTASEINSNLDQVQELVGEGECTGASEAALEVSAQVEALEGVDAKLKEALREGAARLNEVVASCEQAVTEETAPAIEEAEEAEEPEEEEKKEKEKPEKAGKPGQDAEEEESPEETTTPTLPPQAEGEAKGHEKNSEEEAPPAEAGSGGTSAGGVGPGTPAGSE